MDLLEPIELRPGVRNGKPYMSRHASPCTTSSEYLADGMSEGEILADFPELRRDYIRAALVFAAGRERRLAASA